MLDERLTQSLHFTQGKVRGALCVSFLVGVDQVPTTADINFGRVEVVKNFNYKNFGNKCRYSDRFTQYGRAAALILQHLEASTEDEDIYNRLIHVPKEGAFKRGSDINQAFMVAANHLVGRVMREEDRLAIYRVHNPDDDTLREIIGPEHALYSTTPGVHEGLGLDVYTRVTSPLRRSEDFIMLGLLRARAREIAMGSRDERIVKTAVRRGNQRIVANAFNNYGVARADRDTWRTAA